MRHGNTFGGPTARWLGPRHDDRGIGKARVEPLLDPRGLCLLRGIRLIDPYSDDGGPNHQDRQGDYGERTASHLLVRGLLGARQRLPAHNPSGTPPAGFPRPKEGRDYPPFSAARPAFRRYAYCSNEPPSRRSGGDDLVSTASHLAGRRPSRGRQTNRPAQVTARRLGRSWHPVPSPQATRRAVTTNLGHVTTKLLSPQTAAASPIGSRASAAASFVPWMRVLICGPIEKRPRLGRYSQVQP